MCASEVEQESPDSGEAPTETKVPPQVSVEFADTIERLRSRADTARKMSKANKGKSTVVAFLAASVLLMVVVGAENVVRRIFVPDIADVAAQRLVAANEAARIAAEEAARKSAEAVRTNAVVEAIDAERNAAQKVILEAEALDASRAAAFATNADAQAALANAKTVALTRNEASDAARVRSAGDITQFEMAQERLKISEAGFEQIALDYGELKTRNIQATDSVLRAERQLAEAAKLSQKKVDAIRALVAETVDYSEEIQRDLQYVGSVLANSDRERETARKAYDTTQAAADTARASVSLAEEISRKATTEMAIAQEAATQAAAALTDTEEKAKAAQKLADEKNNPETIKNRTDRRTKALAEAALASEVAKVARDTTESARKTAERLAAAASTPRSRDDQDTNIQQTITRGGAVAGTIGIAILVLQISVNSMRYYARLAEFYDAQADALLASGDNSHLAMEFLDRFSPTVIDFGRTPTSIYEKALDTIGKVAAPVASRGKA